jgi:membrane protease subunit HflK
VIATATGDADRFRKIVVEYNKAPAVTRERMYLEAMQQVFTNVSKVMVDSRSNSNLLYLPLDRLMQQSAASMMGAPGGPMQSPQPASNAPASAATPETPAQQPAVPSPGPSLRDRLRDAR